MQFSICLLFTVFSCGLCTCNLGNDSNEHTEKNRTDFAVVSSFKTIYCCLKPPNEIVWDFKQKGNSRWQPYPPILHHIYSSSQPSLKDSNRTLEIPNVGWNDEGIYRCRTINSRNQTVAEVSTSLVVYSCIDRKKPEVFPPKTQYGRVGGTATFMCTVDFGCTPDSSAYVSWYSSRNDERLTELLPNHPRYNVTITERYKNTIKETKLVLTNITPDDFATNFTCFVASQNVNESFSVYLREKTVSISFGSSKEQIWAIIILSLVVVLVAIFILGAFYDRVKLCVYSYLPVCGLESFDCHKFKYHVFILHDDDETDNYVADLISSRLQKDSYAVLNSSSVSAGNDLMRMIEISAKGSQSLILIYPTSVPVIKENDNFTRLCAIQQFFSTKSITVIKRSGQQIHPNHVLNDDALRKLVFPLRTHCRFYQVNKFYNKMKLRLPKPHRGYVEFLPEQEALC